MINHKCSGKLGCAVCANILRAKIEGGPKDIITTFVFEAGGEREPPSVDPLFPTSPLKGLSMLETFSGDPGKGGGMFSATWKRAGGDAEMRDIFIARLS